MGSHADTLIALHNALSGLAPAWATAPVGVDYAPSAGVQWQRGTYMPGMAEPVGVGNGVYSRTRVLYVVELFYPRVNRGTRALWERAEIVRDLYFPYRRAVVFGDGVVDKLPSIGQLREQEPTFVSLRVDVALYVDDNPQS